MRLHASYHTVVVWSLLRCQKRVGMLEHVGELVVMQTVDRVCCSCSGPGANAAAGGVLLRAALC
jgi:hypothetical protein